METSLFTQPGRRLWRVTSPRQHHVVPQIIPLAHLFTSTTNPDVAIALESIECWPTGIVINSTTFLRGGGRDLQLLTPQTRFREDLDPDGPHLGVLFSDGRRVTTLDTPDLDPRSSAPIGLCPTNGGGDGSYFRQGIYVYPLPLVGPVVIGVRWSAFGLREQHVSLPGENIVAAAAQAITVWPS
jgi:hypothetical protein